MKKTNLEFVRLTIEGFKSFSSEQVFEFNREAGFMFLRGRNEIDPDLGENGAGKSTIWDALSWVLYGRTPRGARASAIKSWADAPRCAVTLDCVVNGADRVLVRTQTPNSLLLDGDTVSQEELDALLGIDFDAFLNTVLFRQNATGFFDLTPTVRSELFSSILSLDIWDTYSKSAKGERESIEAELDKLDRVIDTQNRHLEVLDANLLQARTEEEGWQSACDEKVAILEEDAKKAESCLESAKHKRVRISKKLAEEEKGTEEIERRFTEKKKTYSDYREDIAAGNAEIRALERQISPLRDELSGVKALGPVCNTCGQEIDSGHVGSREEKIQRDIKALEGEIEELRDVVRFAEDNAAIEKEQYQAAEDELDDVEMIVSKLEGKLAEIDGEIFGASRDMERCENTLIELLEGDNPHTSTVKHQEIQLADAKQDIQDNRDQRAALEEEYAVAKYWVKGFKDIRLSIISEALLHLESEVNQSLSMLGMSGWYVSFAVDQVTKSNTVKRGFVVMVKSPFNEDLVPWEAWSGGEAQRLRLAGQLGFSSFVLDRRGVSVDLEVYDEPTNGLSQSGIEGLLDLFHERSRTLGKEVWIVDHRSLQYGGFSGVVTVVKTEDGSTIQ